MMATVQQQAQQSKQQGLFLNLFLNIIIPVIVLSRFSSAERLGPAWALVVALLFPLGYGLYEMVTEKKYNALSIIGLVSILLTGSLGLLQFDAKWIAVKEAAVPFIIMVAILVSMHTRYPLVRKLIYNDALLDTQKIESRLTSKQQKRYLDTKLKNTSYLVAGAFLLSTISNFVLATLILKSPPGTEGFNAELARMTALSFPVNALPATIMMAIALFYYLGHLKKLTGLELDEMIRQ